MGESDRTIDERRNEAKDVDTLRLLSLLSALSQNAKRPEGDARPSHDLITPAATEAPVRDLPRRVVGPNFTSALSDGSPRRLDAALVVDSRMPAAIPVGGRRRHRWRVAMLALLCVAGGTAAAFWHGFADRLLSRAMGLTSHDIAVALASAGFPKHDLAPTSASQRPGRGEFVVHDQRGPVDQPLPLGISVS